MKKFFTIAAMSLAMLTASAQKSVQGSRFFDNWSVGLVGGGIVPFTQSDSRTFVLPMVLRLISKSLLSLV